MTIEQLHQSQLSAIQELLSTLKNLENLYLNEVKIKEEKNKNLQDLLDENKRIKETNLNLQEKIRLELENAHDRSVALENQIKENQSVKTLLDLESKRQDKLRNDISSERTELNRINSEQTKKEKFLDMEERRLKYFEKTILLIADDEKIRKKLEEIS